MPGLEQPLPRKRWLPLSEQWRQRWRAGRLAITDRQASLLAAMQQRSMAIARTAAPGHTSKPSKQEPKQTSQRQSTCNYIHTAPLTATSPARTLLKRSSLSTETTSACLEISHMGVPSNSLPLDTGQLLRSSAYSLGGWWALGRMKGKAGAAGGEGVGWGGMGGERSGRLSVAADASAA
jgi:hypothetical protein